MIIKSPFCLFLFILIFSSVVSAKPEFDNAEKPKTVILSGFVRDATTGETLTGAVIYQKGKPEVSVSTNSYGYFSLSLSPGSYEIVVQFMGYKSKVITLDIKGDVATRIDLEEQSISLNEVTVTGEKNNHNVVSSEVVTKLNVKEIQNIPVSGLRIEKLPQ